jgi:hypothetical protein
MMSRWGIPANRIAEQLKVNRLTALKYSENPRLIRSIKKSLKKRHACYQVAKEHDCPEPLVWSIALEGKSDHERFRSLGWGLRTWDLWYFNDIDQRFGDEWPGRIPAQLIAHIMYYFSDQGDLVFDPTRPPRLKAEPMAGRWRAVAWLLTPVWPLTGDVGALIWKIGRIHDRKSNPISGISPI